MNGNSIENETRVLDEDELSAVSGGLNWKEIVDGAANTFTEFCGGFTIGKGE
jgi:bacteriocin-like protein